MPQIIKDVHLQDRIEVPTSRTMTKAGQMIVPCAFARTGQMDYLATNLGIKDAKAGDKVTVFRDEADVFDEDSMQSFRSSPVTVGHPKDKDGNNIKLTADNADELQVGFLEGMPLRDEDLLSGTLVITNKSAIDLIVDEEVSELSAGYTCDLEIIDTDDGEVIYQRNIRANHIAIVPKGRAGAHVRIADEEIEKSGKEVLIADALKGVEEETIELAEAQTVMFKAKAAYDASYEVVLNSASRLDEHRRAAGYYDEADAKDTEVVKDYIDLSVHDELLDKVTALEDSIDEIKKASEKDMLSRVDVVLDSLDATNLTVDAFEGKTNLEIKKMVLADRLPKLTLDDKSEAYIDARFDVVCEDVEGESEMSKEFRKAHKETKVVDAVDIVKEARQRSIERQKR